MNRTRTFAAVALVAVALFAAAPALQARPLSKPQVSVPATGGEWLSVAWNWLAQTFRLQPATPAWHQKAKPDPTSTDPNLGGAKPMTGSCIDPNGCYLGGGGGL